ncbi:MAG: class I SAM-dependent methyltransferase [Bacteroidia bacterium]
METLDPRYETELLEFSLGGISFSLVRVTNTDALYADLVAKGPGHEDVLDERIPYWADLWPSALALAETVRTHQAIKPGIEVLELGCGLGLPGIVAGKKGAKVVLTDYMGEPLQFARHNWKLNMDSEPELSLLDWRKPEGTAPCDVLLASDIAYEKRAFEYLPHAFRNLVKPGGLILLSEPCRMLAASFFDKLPGLGFCIERTAHTVSLNQRKYDVNVYEIRENSG